MAAAMIETGNLAELAKEIDDHWQLFQQAARTTIDEALEIGERLLTAHEQVPWGGWQKWVEANCPFGIRREQQFRKLAEHRDLILGKCELDSQFTISDALEEIRMQEGVKRLKGDVPKQIERACEGGDITHDDAVALKLELTKQIQALEAGKTRPKEVEDQIHKGLRKASTARKEDGQIGKDETDLPHEVAESGIEATPTAVASLETGHTPTELEAFLQGVGELVALCGGAAKLEVPALTQEQIKTLDEDLRGAAVNVHRLRRRINPNS